MRANDLGKGKEREEAGLGERRKGFITRTSSIITW